MNVENPEISRPVPRDIKIITDGYDPTPRDTGFVPRAQQVDDAGIPLFGVTFSDSDKSA